MKTDISVSEAIFRGDQRAFSTFVEDCRGLFLAHLRRTYPTSQSDFKDVFQEASLELWLQIVDGKMTQDKLYVDLSTYLISIGKNMFREEIRTRIRFQKFKAGHAVRRKKKDEEETVEDGKHPIQTLKQQKELDTHLYTEKYNDKDDEVRIQRVIVSKGTDYESFSPEQKIKWRDIVDNAVKQMQEPCRSVLRDTWWNDLSDKEILEASNGLFKTTEAVRVRRKRCHEKLQAVLRPNYEAIIS